MNHEKRSITRTESQGKGRGITIKVVSLYFLPMADDDGRCGQPGYGVAVAVVLRAGRQNNQDFSAKITKISAKITKICLRYGRR